MTTYQQLNNPAVTMDSTTVLMDDVLFYMDDAVGGEVPRVVITADAPSAGIVQ